MKKFIVLSLVMVLLLASFSPVLAGNGNGGGGGNGGGSGGHGNGNSASNGHNGLGGGGQDNYAMVGIVMEISGSAEAGGITIAVYGGQDKILVGTEVTVHTDSDTRFVLQDYGIITFEQIVVGDAVSVAIGTDGNAERVTVVIGCPCLMY